jgi:hypothetical protein
VIGRLTDDAIQCNHCRVLWSGRRCWNGAWTVRLRRLNESCWLSGRRCARECSARASGRCLRWLKVLPDRQIGKLAGHGSSLHRGAQSRTKSPAPFRIVGAE